MVTTTAPANYLSKGVTDLNRNYLWSKLTDAEQGKYTTPTAPAAGTTGGGTTPTGTTGTTTPTTTTVKKFVSMNSTTELSSTAFTNRLDSRSAAPSSTTLANFGKLWTSDALLQAQLTTSVDPADGQTKAINGGAVFVSIKSGTVADSTRPYNGSTGDTTDPALLSRGKNPYGYFSTDPALSETPFVKQTTNPDGSVTEESWSDSTGKTYKEWLTTAKDRYSQFESLVTKQMDGLSATFGTEQGLLGYDVNNNGFIDSEKELFGFDKGLNLNGSATITSADKLSTESFTFLTGDRLTGDRLDSAQPEEDKAHYRRFMVMNADGSSTSLLQSQTGFAAGINQYVSVQSRLTFESGGATLTSVAQQGFSVTA